MIILASQSLARRALLERAGIRCSIMPSPFDEAQAKASLPEEPKTRTLALARGKALAVSKQQPKDLVIGADQTLFCAGTFHDKPGDRQSARRQLQALRGRTHILTSAVSCMLGGEETWSCSDEAHVTFREFSDAELDGYLDAAGTGIFSSVGAYHYEGIGIRLMEQVKGSDHTILGLPILPLLAYLRSRGLTAP